MKPYTETNNGNIVRRTFSNNIPESELVWHRDHEDRVVLPLNENDWMVQFDNELPRKLTVGEEYFIPKNTFHRVIKGSGELQVEIIKTDFDEVIEEGKKKKKRDACYHKVRARYDVWPSAYASGALVKCRKVGAANWGNKSNEGEVKINEDDFIKNIAHINDIVTIKKSKEIYNLLSNMFPNAKEVIDYHFKDELGQPFAEWRRLIYEIDNYVLTGPKMVNPDLIELDDETISDRQTKYNQYIKDKEAGKPAQYFRGNDTDPRSIDFSKLPPITLIAVGGKYELVDGAHRIFLAKQANKPLKAYIWVKQKNTHPNVAKIKSLFNQTNTNLEEKWSEGYKKSIDCSNPKGFSQKAHCDARKKRQRGEETKSKSVSEDIGKSARKQFKKDLQQDTDYLKFKDKENEFGVPNVTVNDPFIKKSRYTRVGKEDLDELTVYEAKKTDFSKEKSQGLHGWFSRKGGEGSSGWVDCNTCRKNPKTGRKKCKPCGRQEGEDRKYPACRPTPSACGTRGKGKKWGKKSTNEELNISENFSIFDKNYIKMILHETFNHEEPLVMPAEPKTKPKESPMIQPSRRNKPFLPERETQPDPKAEN